MSLLPPNPNKRQHPPTPIGRVLNKYVISLSDLTKCLLAENITISSRTTLHRLVHGKASHEVRSTLAPAAARCLSKFLVDRGLNKSEIDIELTAAFTTEEYQPMISKRNRLNADEISFFGLTEDPFKKFPESREEVFLPPQLREVFDQVLDAVNYQQFIAVIGPIGSGKSTLRDYLHDHVERDGRIKLIRPFFMDQAKVTPMGIASEILKACDVGKIPSRATTLGGAVVNTLRRLTENGYRLALDFDECHKMNQDAVRSLKNFLEMSSGGFKKYLGVVLFGWPSFVTETLVKPEFQEIYERVQTIDMPKFFDMAPDYLAHRFALVGRKDISKLFDADAIEFICSQAETPLGLGNIANEALKVTKRDAREPRVTGSFIRGKMFFETNNRREPGFRKR